MDSSNEINELIEINPAKRFSGFGVILDATRGQRIKSQAIEYCTQIKIIDKSLNPIVDIDKNYAKKYITLFIYWNQDEFQPFVHKIGDIIRFYNFEFELYNGYLQGKNRKNSTWKIYHGDSQINEPYAHSSDSKEKATQLHVSKLGELREWTRLFFDEHSLMDMDWYSMDRQLNNPSTLQSFDMLLRVEEVRASEDAINESILVVFVDDQFKRYRLKQHRLHMTFLRAGDIVKVRSIERIENDVLVGHSKYNAILTIPPYFLDCKKFKEAIKIIEDQRSKSGSPVEKTPSYHHPGFDIAFFKKKGIILPNGNIVSSRIGTKWINDIQITPIAAILEELNQTANEDISRENHRYLIEANLIDIQPRDLSEAIRNQCKNCKLLRKVNAPEGEVCCQLKMERILIARFLWMDESTEMSSKCLVTYSFPEDGDLNKDIFPDFNVSYIKASEVRHYQTRWENLIEKHLEGDRVFNVLLAPFENAVLQQKDNQVPLRIFDTMFLPVLDE